jgi:hypothetical protein
MGRPAGGGTSSAPPTPLKRASMRPTRALIAQAEENSRGRKQGKDGSPCGEIVLTGGRAPTGPS